MMRYYSAKDYRAKEEIHPPGNYECKASGVYHPKNPFPGMVVMKNTQGCKFEIVDDACITLHEENFKNISGGGCKFAIYEENFKDITDEVYKEYLDMFRPLKRSFLKKLKDLIKTRRYK